MFWPLLLRRDVASGIAGGFTGRQPVTNARNIALPRFNSNYTVRLIKCSKVPGLLQNLYGDSGTVDFRGVRGRKIACKLGGVVSWTVDYVNGKPLQGGGKMES